MTAPAPSRHLLRARDLIDARYAEPLDVAALAGRAYASEAHFIRSFRRVFGETPHQYLITRRIERAQELLRAPTRRSPACAQRSGSAASARSAPGRGADFYTQKLGMVVRDDARMGDFRWLTVGPPASPTWS